MKWQIILLSTLFFVFMSFSTVWANEEAVGESDSQISTSSIASFAPLMKSSSSKSSSSSSKTKIKDGDDDTTDVNDTDDSSGGFPWWMIVVIIVVVLGIIGLVIWYLFLR